MERGKTGKDCIISTKIAGYDAISDALPLRVFCIIMFLHVTHHAKKMNKFCSFFEVLERYLVVFVDILRIILSC